MEQNQGQPTEQPAAQAPPEKPADISGLQQFLAEPEKPAAVQGQPPVQPDPAVELLRLANQRQAQVEALTAEVQRLKNQPPVDSQNKNPYDPQVDPWGWQRWENQTAARDAATQAAAQTLQVIMQQAQLMSQQNREAQWAQAHPGVDINLVKSFAEARRIGELDDAYTLMTLNQQVQGAVQQAQSGLLNQFRQPANVAQPVRAQGGQGAPVSLRFETMLEAYTSNPNIENTWPPQLREAFHRELDMRVQTGG